MGVQDARYTAAAGHHRAKQSTTDGDKTESHDSEERFSPVATLSPRPLTRAVGQELRRRTVLYYHPHVVSVLRQRCWLYSLLVRSVVIRIGAYTGTL